VRSISSDRSIRFQRSCGFQNNKQDTGIQKIDGENDGNNSRSRNEANALLNCSREQTIGADLYLTGINPEDSSIHEAKPCPLCARMIIQAGIKNVYLRVGKGVGEYKVVPAEKLLWVVGDTD